MRVAMVLIESFQLIEETVGFAVRFSGPAFLGSLVVLVNVLELLLALLGASVVSKLR